MFCILLTEESEWVAYNFNVQNVSLTTVLLIQSIHPKNLILFFYLCLAAQKFQKIKFLYLAILECTGYRTMSMHTHSWLSWFWGFSNAMKLQNLSKGLGTFVLHTKPDIQFVQTVSAGNKLGLYWFMMNRILPSGWSLCIGSAWTLSKAILRAAKVLYGMVLCRIKVVFFS